MSYSYRVRHEAVAELTDAYIWYEEQKKGLGDLLRTKVFNKINLICKNPYHYKIAYKNHRQILIEKFPFLVVYTIDEENKLITVLAIFHTSRNPKRKSNR